MYIVAMYLLKIQTWNLKPENEINTVETADPGGQDGSRGSTMHSTRTFLIRVK